MVEQDQTCTSMTMMMLLTAMGVRAYGKINRQVVAHIFFCQHKREGRRDTRRDYFITWTNRNNVDVRVREMEGPQQNETKIMTKTGVCSAEAMCKA